MKKPPNVEPNPIDDQFVSMSVDEKKALYLNMMHGMQSGVAHQLVLNPKLCTPKDLRVGVNSALIQDSALAQLLMEKGIITEEEYWTRILRLLTIEITNLRREVAQRMNVPIEKVNFA